MTTGHRLEDEAHTLIVGTLRGGAPLAEGVASAFPYARLALVKKPQELSTEVLRGIRSVVLVDAVVSTGRSSVQFVRWLRGGVAVGARTVVVSGSGIERALGRRVGVTAVALRVPENRFAGSGGADTGNRLFDTTDLE
jgi:uracil phosphoribosyltransferase